MADIRPYDASAAGIEELSQLFGTVFPFSAHMTPEYVDWTYERNPDGPAIALNAYVDGRLAAHFAVTAFRAQFQGRSELGVQMQHAATAPGYQGKGLFPALVEAALERARDAGYGFALGPANQLSTRLFVERHGFRFVRPLDVRIGVGPAAPRREDGARPVDFERVFDRDALAWRLARPDRPYCVRRGPETTRVFSAKGVRGIPVELGTYPSDHVPDLPEASARHPLRAWIGLDPNRSWWGRPYAPLPMRLRPAPLNMVFRDLTGADRCPHPDRARADMLDYDAF